MMKTIRNGTTRRLRLVLAIVIIDLMLMCAATLLASCTKHVDDCKYKAELMPNGQYLYLVSNWNARQYEKSVRYFCNNGYRIVAMNATEYFITIVMERR